MDTLETLSLAMGTAWTSGLNLYATVATLGLAGSAGMIQLPPGLQILTEEMTEKKFRSRRNNQLREVPLRRKRASGENEELNYAAAATIHGISAGLRITG